MTMQGYIEVEGEGLVLYADGIHLHSNAQTAWGNAWDKSRGDGETYVDTFWGSRCSLTHRSRAVYSGGRWKWQFKCASGRLLLSFPTGGVGSEFVSEDTVTLKAVIDYFWLGKKNASPSNLDLVFTVSKHHLTDALPLDGEDTTWVDKQYFYKDTDTDDDDYMIDPEFDDLRGTDPEEDDTFEIEIPVDLIESAAGKYTTIGFRHYYDYKNQRQGSWGYKDDWGKVIGISLHLKSCSLFLDLGIRSEMIAPADGAVSQESSPILTWKINNQVAKVVLKVGKLAGMEELWTKTVTYDHESGELDYSYEEHYGIWEYMYYDSCQCGVTLPWGTDCWWSMRAYDADEEHETYDIHYFSTKTVLSEYDGIPIANIAEFNGGDIHDITRLCGVPLT